MRFRPVRAPAAHQVQHFGLLGNQPLKQLANRIDGSVVNMDNEPRHRVKLGVIAIVLPLEKIRREVSRIHCQTQTPDETDIASPRREYRLLTFR